MSIDYDRLRGLVRIADGLRDVRDWETEADAERELENLASVLACELLRLRLNLTDLRDLMYTHAAYLRKDGYGMAADYAENHVFRLTRILKGDTE